MQIMLNESLYIGPNNLQKTLLKGKLQWLFEWRISKISLYVYISHHLSPTAVCCSPYICKLLRWNKVKILRFGDVIHHRQGNICAARLPPHAILWAPLRLACWDSSAVVRKTPSPFTTMIFGLVQLPSLAVVTTTIRFRFDARSNCLSKVIKFTVT